MTETQNGVTYPLGFQASGVTCGLKTSGKPDLALVVNQGPDYQAAAVFTANRSRANPVIWCQEVIGAGRAKAVVLNSGGANCFTGERGYNTVVKTAETAAGLCGAEAAEVLVCSTGIIGEYLPEGKVLAGVQAAYEQLSVTGGPSAAEAILTTDTRTKTATYQSETDGWRIGAMAKGAGMIAPCLATMLAVITTDARITAEQADTALRYACSLSFDRIDVDGCMSTNDQVTLLASGAAGVAADETEFAKALRQVCQELACAIVADAEGAKHRIKIRVRGAVEVEEALAVARTVARSNLFKTAIFGKDPNWGRILAAMGTANASFDPYAAEIGINGVMLCSRGDAAQPKSAVDLSGPEVRVEIDLRAGNAEATIHTTDLTTDYVHENSAYST